jgi:hypothetical protein
LFLKEVLAMAQAAARKAPVLSLPVLSKRVVQLYEWFVLLQARQLNTEACLSRDPRLRRQLRALPRDLKARAPAVIPFDARLWARGHPGERSRSATAVAWLRDHPELSVDEVARAHGLGRRSFSQSAAYRELRRGRPGPKCWRGGHNTGGVERAKQYLATHRPASLNEVARAVGVGRCALSSSPSFRRAWAKYARTGPVSKRSRAHFGLTCRRKGRNERPGS